MKFPRNQNNVKSIAGTFARWINVTSEGHEVHQFKFVARANAMCWSISGAQYLKQAVSQLGCEIPGAQNRKGTERGLTVSAI